MQKKKNALKWLEFSFLGAQIVLHLSLTPKGYTYNVSKDDDTKPGKKSLKKPFPFITNIHIPSMCRW